jgi:hypothetical protein
MSPPSLYPKDSKFQASEILKPFDFTTHPDWPINPPLNFNLKEYTTEKMPEEKVAAGRPYFALDNKERENLHLKHQPKSVPGICGHKTVIPNKHMG